MGEIFIFLIFIIFGGASGFEINSPCQITGNFSTEYRGSVNKSVECTYWFTELKESGQDVTVKVRSSVDDNVSVENPVRFEVQWVEFIEQDSRSWVLPVLGGDEDGTPIIYRQSNRTLCNDDPLKFETVTIKVTVSTLSNQSVNFSLFVYTYESNVISSLHNTTKHDFNVTLFSPVFYKLKIENVQDEANLSGLSEFALLEVDSVDDACISVALQELQCPVMDAENNVNLDRHLTMSSTASITIKMSYLVEGRFLVFVLHQNDSMCKSDCDGCWKDNILPMDLTSNLRTKQISFKLRQKIPNNQYLFASLLSCGFLLGVLFVFPVIYCTCQTIKERRARNVGHLHQSNDVHHNMNDDRELIDDISDNVEMEETYVFGFLRKRPRYCDRNAMLDAKSRIANRYFGTLLVNAIFYILPAIQLIWIYQRVFEVTGNEDICYFNFRCLHPLMGITAFNHLVSNIGYVLLGFLFCIVVKADKVGSRTSGLFQAMGIALVIQGIMSGLYHTCPSQLSFQFDTCFMYVTAMLVYVHIYQAHNPATGGSAILSYAVVAVAVALGVAAVLSRVWYFWICIASIHILLCLVVSLHLDSLWQKYEWGFVWPCKMGFQQFLCSFVRPFHRDSFTLCKIALVSLNLINWGAAGVGLWLFQGSQDFASYMLLLFIVNLFLFSSAYFYMKFQQRKVSYVTGAYLFALIPIWSIALFFYYRVSTSWAVSPAESRTLNRDCALFEFFDDHDIWHFTSAFGMFLNFMLFFTMDDGDGERCVSPRDNGIEDGRGIVKSDDDEVPDI